MSATMEDRRLYAELEQIDANGRTMALGQRFQDCSKCPVLTVVPAGSYIMGSPEDEEGRYHLEAPMHRVTITEPFAVGVFEVTFAEWDACRLGGAITESCVRR